MCHKRLEIVEASQGVVTTERVHGEYAGRIAFESADFDLLARSEDECVAVGFECMDFVEHGVIALVARLHRGDVFGILPIAESVNLVHFGLFSVAVDLGEDDDIFIVARIHHESNRYAVGSTAIEKSLAIVFDEFGYKRQRSRSAQGFHRIAT